MDKNEMNGFSTILLFLIGGILFIILALLVARLLRPSRPGPEKLKVYECGEEPAGNAWGRFNIRFYVIALIFILFDVEIVFLFPWSVVFANKNLMQATSGLWGWYTFTEMSVFIMMLVLGLFYAWKTGLLEWEKLAEKTGNENPAVLPEKYRKINLKYGNYQSTEINKNPGGTA